MIFVFNIKNKNLFLILYVFIDLLNFSKNETELDFVVDKLREHFTLKVMTNAENFIGLQIQQNYNKIKIRQTRYIKKLCSNYGIENDEKNLILMKHKLNLFDLNSKFDKHSVKEF